MKIRFCRPRPEQDARFYTVLFDALRRYHDTQWCDRPPPVPPDVPGGRPHEALWTWFDETPVFLDMSDHVFLFDRAALRHAAVYFKANWHRGVAKRVWADAGLPAEWLSKCVPFLFLPPALRHRRWLRIAGWSAAAFLPRRQLCHIVGVYENRARDGETSPCAAPDPTPWTPAACHFWTRWETRRALMAFGLSGTFRLVSRGQPALEDRVHVWPNLAPTRFFLELARSRMVVINTLPHAVLPWKALETLAVGRPLVLDCAPRVEVPEPFRLIPDEHFIELLPGLGDYDLSAPMDDPRATRVLTRFTRDHLRAGVERVAAVLRDRARLAAMEQAVRTYQREVLHPRTIADYVVRAFRARVSPGAREARPTPDG